MRFLGSSRFKNLLNSVKKGFNRLASKFSYDFWEEMTKNEIAKSTNPQKSAVKWYYDNYQGNPERRIKRRIVQQGSLVIFDYDKPKYEDTLAYFDRNPLVLVLAPFYTKEEKVRVLGINLHLLPYSIRMVVLYQAFLIYKTEYTAQLFSNKDALQVNIEWQMIKKQLEKYGAGFAIRMYIPNLMKNIIEFNMDDWKYAIHIPSRAYQDITVSELEREWQAYIKKQKNKVSTAGASHFNK